MTESTLTLLEVVVLQMTSTHCLTLTLLERANVLPIDGNGIMSNGDNSIVVDVVVADGFIIDGNILL